MSRAEVSKHYARLLSRWPTDRLRPEVQFRNLLRARIAAAPAIKQSSEQNEAQALPYSGVKHSKRDELKEVNAAYLLLDDTFAKQFPPSQNLMKPTSSPNHYDYLARELDEAPDRTWYGNFVMRMKRMVRFQ